MASSKTPLKVLIVGSGVGGAVLALALHRLSSARPNYALEIVLVDAASSFRAVGAGFSLTANAVRPLRQLGIFEKLLEVSQKCPRIVISDEKSKSTLASFDQPPLMYGQPLLTVERAKLQEVILAELEAVGITIKFSKRLERIRQPDSSEPGSGAQAQVEATFEDGTTESADIIVGADGAWSRVRDFVDGPPYPSTKDEDAEAKKKNMPEFTGWSGVVGVSEPLEGISDDKLGETHWVVSKTGKGGYGTWGLQDHRQFWYIVESDSALFGNSVPKYAHADLQATIDKYSSSWHPLTGSFTKIMQNSKHERVYKLPLVQRVYPKIVSDAGNIVLIGDAAHPMAPFIGQGAAMGIEDAIVLANALLPPDGAEPRGAKWYEEKRKGRTEAVIKQGITTGKLNMGETIFWRAARYLAFNVLKVIIAMTKRAREASKPAQPQEGEVEQDVSPEGGPMAWIHKEVFELEM